MNGRHQSAYLSLSLSVFLQQFTLSLCLSCHLTPVIIRLVCRYQRHNATNWGRAAPSSELQTIHRAQGSTEFAMQELSGRSANYKAIIKQRWMLPCAAASTAQDGQRPGCRELPAPGGGMDQGHTLRCSFQQSKETGNKDTETDKKPLKAGWLPSRHQLWCRPLQQ